MKTKFLIIAFACLLGVAFSSCKKELTVPDSLVGLTYVAENPKLFESEYADMRIFFETADSAIITSTYVDGRVCPEKSKYEYKKPQLEFFEEEESQGRGTVYAGYLELNLARFNLQ